MRIDPKPYTLDVMERATIAEALRAHVANLTRRIASCKQYRIRVLLETELARAEDLLSTLKA